MMKLPSEYTLLEALQILGPERVEGLQINLRKLLGDRLKPRMEQYLLKTVACALDSIRQEAQEKALAPVLAEIEETLRQRQKREKCRAKWRRQKAAQRLRMKAQETGEEKGTDLA